MMRTGRPASDRTTLPEAPRPVGGRPRYLPRNHSAESSQEHDSIVRAHEDLEQTRASAELMEAMRGSTLCHRTEPPWSKTSGEPETSLLFPL
jgi:hypothetical protein